MMLLIPIILVIILLLYTIKIMRYRRNWVNYPEFHPGGSSNSIPISVVIAFRNEKENLPQLLHSLQHQNYPAGLWEAVLVDDHSTDGSTRLVKDFIRIHPGFRYLQNEPGDTGKKSAMHKGVRLAAYDLIVTTDADCTLGEAWLSTISEFYREQKPVLIIGLVDMEGGRGFFNAFQEVEFLSLVAAGAAAAAGGSPIYCNAANLAFEKDLMLSYPDPMYSAVPSGDDTLFMHRIKRHHKNRIMMLKSGEAVVKTRNTKNWKEFINQRSRWASKTPYYTDKDALHTAWLVFVVSLATIVSLILAVSGIYPVCFPLLAAGKCLTDYFFLKEFFKYFGKKPLFIQLLFFEAIYPLYICIAALAGIFNLYSWKERWAFKTEK
jgi:poly-beta-1,6-N-acetyl-D-glucosamine synthase